MKRKCRPKGQLSELKRRFLEIGIKTRHIKKPSQHYLLLHDNYIKQRKLGQI